MLVCTLLTGSIRATSGISEERSAVDTTHREQISLQILFSRSSSEIELGFADNSINIESFFAALRRSSPLFAGTSSSVPKFNTNANRYTGLPVRPVYSK